MNLRCHRVAFCHCQECLDKASNSHRIWTRPGPRPSSLSLHGLFSLLFPFHSLQWFFLRNSNFSMFFNAFRRFHPRLSHFHTFSSSSQAKDIFASGIPTPRFPSIFHDVQRQHSEDTSIAAVEEHLLQGRPFVVTDGARGLPMAVAC